MRVKEFIRPLTHIDRLREKFTVDKGKVIQIVVQYESFIKNKWLPIIRFDTAHSYFHKDIINPDGTQTKIKISHLSLNDALTYAELDILNNWQSYKVNYLEKMTHD